MNEGRMLLVSGAKMAKCAIVRNLLRAHRRICENATTQDVRKIRQMTRLVMCSLDRIGEDFEYLVAEKREGGGADPPDDLEDLH